MHRKMSNFNKQVEILTLPFFHASSIIDWIFGIDGTS